MNHVVAIGLKIPDNSAYTALVTLRRLGIDVARIERCDVLRFAGAPGDGAELRARVERDETLFNPNKHRLAVLHRETPRAGEVWIETIDDRRTDPSPCVGWRLFGHDDAPATIDVLKAAVAALLCNPAIERAVFPS
jgi:hypothetical protein